MYLGLALAFDQPRLDPLLALIVACNVLWQGWKVMASSVDGLMDRALCVSVAGVGLLGPGFDGWTMGRSVLRGDLPWVAGPMPTAQVTVLPPAERRRCPEAVRIALSVAQQALEQSGLSASEATSVFATSDFDGRLTHATYEALAADSLL